MALLIAALSVPYKLSPHLANDIVKQMLRQMPGILQQQGQRVVGRMPGSVLPIVVDDEMVMDEEGEEEEEEEQEDAPQDPASNATVAGAVETG